MSDTYITPTSTAITLGPDPHPDDVLRVRLVPGGGIPLTVTRVWDPKEQALRRLCRRANGATP